MNDRVWDFLELVQEFDAGSVLTTRQIARRYGISTRTAQRWIQTIECHRNVQRIWLPAGLNRLLAYRVESQRRTAS